MSDEMYQQKNVLVDEILLRIAERYKKCEINIFPTMPEMSPVEAVLRCAKEEGFVLTNSVESPVKGEEAWLDELMQAVHPVSKPSERKGCGCTADLTRKLFEVAPYRRAIMKRNNLIGSIWMDRLANTPIGDGEVRQLEMRVECPRDMEVNVLRLFFITPSQQKLQNKTGYAAGDGGSYVVELQDVSGRVLAGASLNSPLPVWPVIKFPWSVKLSGGIPYRIVVWNLTPDTGYSSINAVLSTCGQSGINPDNNMVRYWDANGEPILRVGYLPIFSLEGPTDQFGFWYMETEKDLLGKYSRQIVIPEEDLYVTSVSYRSDPLFISRVAPFLPLSQHAEDLSYGITTNKFVMSSKLAKGQRYEFYFPPGMAPIRKGTTQGFPDPWPGAFAEFSDDGVTYAPIPGKPLDLQMVFQIG